LERKERRNNISIIKCLIVCVFVHKACAAWGLIALFVYVFKKWPTSNNLSHVPGPLSPPEVLLTLGKLAPVILWPRATKCQS
jgi:hypothetical protein